MCIHIKLRVQCKFHQNKGFRQKRSNEKVLEKCSGDAIKFFKYDLCECGSRTEHDQYERCNSTILALMRSPIICKKLAES